MNLGQLRALTREWIDDEVAPYLTSDARLNSNLNEAQREAAVRARLLLDSTTPAVCQIQLTAGVATYALHKAVIVVRRAATSLRPSEPLVRTRFEVLDADQADWRTRESKDPEYLVQNLDSGWLTISPIPTEDQVLHLTVWRYPLENEALEQNGDDPCIGEQHHEFLCHWAAYRVFMKRDAEVNSTKDAEDQLALFERHFGVRPTSKQLQELSIDPSQPTTSYYF